LGAEGRKISSWETEGDMENGMRGRARAWRLRRSFLGGPRPEFVALLLISVCLFWAVSLGRAAPVEVPTVNADLGPCTADFTVTDGARQPLYNAKVSVTVKYGFLGLRRMELEVGTNSDGKARVAGLPSKVRKHPLGFVISYGD
jgi:hypothetical protein